MTEDRYNRPEPGTSDWHEPLNGNFRDLDSEVVAVVDTWDDLPEDAADVERSSNGQWPRYVVLEHEVTVRVSAADGDGSITREIVGGLGSAERPLPQLWSRSLDSDRALIGEPAFDPYPPEDANSLVVGNGGNENSLGFVGPAGGHVGRFRWFRDDGESIGLLEFDDTDDKELSLYAGTHETEKRFNIDYDTSGGENAGYVHFPSLTSLLLERKQGGDFELRFHRQSGEDSMGIDFEDGSKSNLFRIRSRKRPSGPEIFEISRSGTGPFVRWRDGNGLFLDRGFEAHGAVSHDQNESRDVVWESGGSDGRPAAPVEGQRYFDADLGRPIWYDGESWVDARGDQV